VGYFTINPFIRDGSYDIDFLNQMPAEYENDYVRHVHFSKPLLIRIDGKHNKGVIMKPEV
jgi:hypothetical protein